MRPEKYKIFGHDYLRKDEVVQCLSYIIDELVRQGLETGNILHGYNAAAILIVKEFFENL